MRGFEKTAYSSNRITFGEGPKNVLQAQASPASHPSWLQKGAHWLLHMGLSQPKAKELARSRSRSRKMIKPPGIRVLLASFRVPGEKKHKQLEHSLKFWHPLQLRFRSSKGSLSAAADLARGREGAKEMKLCGCPASFGPKYW